MEGRVVGSLTSVRSNCKEFGMTYGGKPLGSRSFHSTTLRGKENSPILDGVVSTDSTQLVKDPVSGKWRKVLRFVANPRVLKAAYLKIKSKPGNLTPKPDGETTLDGLSMEWFADTGKAVGSGSYQPKLVRRKHLRKPKPVRRKHLRKPKGDLRPLWIPCLRDKIVQEAVRMALNHIFEPTFYDCSHGFRKSRGCHTALQQVKLKFGRVNWFIEGDITKCSDTLDHKILVKLLSDKIDDKGFLDLFHKWVKVGYVGRKQFVASGKVGSPQDSLISPVLSNIYLHQLDRYIMEVLKPGFEKGKKRKENPEYTKICQGGKGSAKEAFKRGVPTVAYMDPGFKRLQYVRYADDFLIGVIGSKADAMTVRSQVQDFLAEDLNLELNVEKTKVTHAGDNVVYFLGTNIRIAPPSKHPRSKRKDGLVVKKAVYPQLRLPLKRLAEELKAKGYLHARRKSPTRVGWLTAFSPAQIIQHYNSVYRGIAAYYSFVDDKPLLNRISYILKYSAALTLASKLRLKTKRKVFKKFGANLTIMDGENKPIVSFVGYKYSSKKVFRLGTRPLDLSNLRRWRPRRTDNITNATECCICGAERNLHMHHVKHCRKMGRSTADNPLKAQMVRINRKQIPVCLSCHLKIRKGEYDGMALKSFPGANFKS